MKKSTKIFTTGIMATTLVAPNIVMAANIENENLDININLEKRTVLLGDKSKVSISFKENQNADSITLNYLCYDMQLSTILNYNPETNSYEGEINFNKDPEYLNVWELENITINGEIEKVLNTTDLEKLGLNLDDYKVTQDYIITDYSTKSISNYKQKTSVPVKKLIGEERHHTAVKVSQEGWANGSDKVIIVNGTAIADGVTATPLATAYNAPILLSANDSVPKETLDEIARLKPSEVIVIGGDKVVPEKVINTLKSSTKLPVRRIGGVDRHETSLKIAQELDKKYDVNKIYVVNGYKGESEALSIAPKAGIDNQPIILTYENSLPDSTYNWLKKEDLKDAYFIGNEKDITTDVIHQVYNITTVNTAAGQSVYKNRVNGKDKHEINDNVINKFYTETNLDAMIVAKSDVLVDALTAGPLAAKLNAPILLNPTNSVSSYHEDTLKNKSADLVYQVGGGMNDSIINDIAYKLSERNSGDKTVVIDPGHGGSDSGALNKVDPSIMEKNYTLDTSLAAAQYLRDNNINVVLTRETDKTMALAERTSLSNSIDADLLVSVHYNSYNTVAKGVEVFYKNADKNGGTSKTLATNILNSILSKFNLTNRGIKTKLNDSGKDYYHMIRESNAPSVIVECSFIDNENDQTFVNTLEKRKLMGTQIGKGIENTLK